MENGKSLKIGDRFPEVTVHTTLGAKTLPTDYRGRWFILFSHPSDFTPVCTTEFIAFEQWKDSFRKLNTELIGLSVDQVFSHLKWIEWIKEKTGVEITFPVIADPLGKLARTLGMIDPDKGTRPVRGVFVVDENGVIKQMLYYPQEVGRNIGEIWRSVHALQTAHLYGVATPENWPNNHLIGSHVIVPPADTVAKIKERYEQQKQGHVQCLDWWFCYKKLW
ncbi:peroxiredoxin [Anoxybacillus sp. J5B_2022]|uniref:peroxiredoxin n=1 Tax=Anoxybacillus sp. J5B_2022 TaxID=3003246 RepID=UPI0022859F8B|nr:peroxiredoxin [Anoxybacillus sp. J5B_2022]MCZ0756090.1 peroxiredoxin [Anoxybacillus sp. J5B_2022]